MQRAEDSVLPFSTQTLYMCGIKIVTLHSRRLHTRACSNNNSPIRANTYFSTQRLDHPIRANEAIGRSLLFPHLEVASWTRASISLPSPRSGGSRNRCNFTPPSSSCSRDEVVVGKDSLLATDFSRGIRGNFTNPTAVLYVIKSVPVLESLEFFADTSAVGGDRPPR